MNINYEPIVVPSIYVRRGVVRRMIECTNGRGHPQLKKWTLASHLRRVDDVETSWPDRLDPVWVEGRGRSRESRPGPGVDQSAWTGGVHEG